jgi:hypothetical protein
VQHEWYGGQIWPLSLWWTPTTPPSSGWAHTGTA